jgi:hypothetical protein
VASTISRTMIFNREVDFLGSRINISGNMSASVYKSATAYGRPRKVCIVLRASDATTMTIVAVFHKSHWGSWSHRPGSVVYTCSGLLGFSSTGFLNNDS